MLTTERASWPPNDKHDGGLVLPKISGRKGFPRFRGRLRRVQHRHTLQSDILYQRCGHWTRVRRCSGVALVDGVGNIAGQQ